MGVELVAEGAGVLISRLGGGVWKTVPLSGWRLWVRIPALVVRWTSWGTLYMRDPGDAVLKLTSCLGNPVPAFTLLILLYVPNDQH
jgi:hypothetical protein